MDFKFCPKCPIKKKAKTFDLSFFNFKLVLQGFLWVKHSAHQSNLNLSS